MTLLKSAIFEYIFKDNGKTYFGGNMKNIFGLILKKLIRKH